jgi:signal transduction histidine kinase
VSLKRSHNELQLLVAGRDDHDLPLANMRDRAEAAGGTVSSNSSGGMVSLDVRLPTTYSLVVV